MRPAYKALLLNFLVFGVLFLIARLILGYYWPENTVFLAVGSAIIASIFAPKFAVIKTNSGEKLMMKWIFIKKVRQL